jgi:hypothetical protein
LEAGRLGGSEAGSITAGILTGVGFNLALWLAMPGVYWMWWNMAGFLVAAGGRRMEFWFSIFSDFRLSTSDFCPLISVTFHFYAIPSPPLSPIIPTSHRGVGIGPYGFQLVERAYSSERSEAASCRAIAPAFRATVGPLSEFQH